MFIVGGGSMMNWGKCEFSGECINKRNCPIVSVVSDDLDSFKAAKSAGLKPERVPKVWYGGPGGTDEQLVRVELCDSARREQRLIDGLRTLWPTIFTDDEGEITASREVEALMDGEQDIDAITTGAGMDALDRITSGEHYIHPSETKLAVIDGALEAISIYEVRPVAE